MTKRMLLTSILAAQFLALPAVKNIKDQARPQFSADMRADDPTPCPDCDASAGPGTGNLAVLRTDDPTPCPDCDASAGPGTGNLAVLRTDDPTPCPDCDASAGPGTGNLA
jgi:positive regulator of sigma E activity